MQGYHFLVVTQDGPISQGVIQRQLTENYYLCKFITSPVVTRVIGLAQIETWNLFPNEEEMADFVTTIVKKPEQEGDDGEEKEE
jgi:hypothetical protein